MELQAHFKKSVRLYFKDQGERWLRQLPELIKICEQKWSLNMEEPYTLSINYVAPAILKNGDEVVVKLCIPTDGFLDEVEALRLFSNNGMVKLIDSDEEQGVIILEKLLPGYTLACLDDHNEACHHAANVMKKIVRKAPSNSRIPTTRAREANLRKLVLQHPEGLGPISSHNLTSALQVFTYLNQTIHTHYLLHGDFHHYNVLSSGDGKWTATDPKGLIGEIEYDLIQFMLNKLPEERAYEVIKLRVEIFTQELGLNKERLLLYGFCHSVLSTSWTVDGDGSFDESFYQGIEIFGRLYKEEFNKRINMVTHS